MSETTRRTRFYVFDNTGAYGREWSWQFGGCRPDRESTSAIVSLGHALERKSRGRPDSYRLGFSSAWSQ